MSFIRRIGRGAFGRCGRRSAIVLAIATAWYWWAWTPLRPLATWTAPQTEGTWDPIWPRISRDGRTFVEISDQPLRLGANPGENGCMAGPVRLWDLPTGRERVSIPGPGMTELRAYIGPDASWVMIWTPFHAGLTLWDGITGKLRAQLRPPDEPDYAPRIRNPMFLASDDGKLIAAAMLNPYAIRVWDSATGRLVAELTGARAPFAFSPDRRQLLTAMAGENNRPGTVAKLWDIATGRELLSLPGHRWPLGSVAFSPDGRLLATGLDQHYHLPDSGDLFDVKLWDASTGRPISSLDVQAGLSLAFSPDSRLLSLWSPSGRGLLWDITQTPPRNRDDLIAMTERVVNGIAGLNSWNGPHYAPGGQAWYVTAEGDTAIAAAAEPTESPRPLSLPHLFGVASHAETQLFPPTPVFSYGGHVLAVPVRADVPSYRPGPLGLVDRVLRRATSATLWSTVRLFDPATGHILGTLPVVAGKCYVLGFTPDGQTFWTKRVIGDPSLPASERTRVFEQWPVPSGWPPWWLLAVTGIGILLLAVDWYCGRRHASAPEGRQIVAQGASPGFRLTAARGRLCRPRAAYYFGLSPRARAAHALGYYLPPLRG